MFNIGPLEVVVLAIVGLIILGPDRLPALAKDAANMLRTLRDLATGARKQLRDELGPEFADVDFRNLNPRTVVSRAVFGEEFDPSKLNPKTYVRNAVFGDDDFRESLREDLRDSDPRTALRETREALYGDGARVNGNGRVNGASGDDAPVTMTKPVTRPAAATQDRPRPRPRPTGPTAAPFDPDAT